VNRRKKLRLAALKAPMPTGTAAPEPDEPGMARGPCFTTVDVLRMVECGTKVVSAKSLHNATEAPMRQLCRHDAAMDFKRVGAVGSRSFEKVLGTLA